MERVVFTIGHSSHSLMRFCELLAAHSIKTIVDVRSAPFSARNPQFNRDTLEAELSSRGIAYVFLGVELGARPSDSRFYRGGRVQYQLLADTDLFRSGLERIRRGVEHYRLALMCAEGDPLQCHRFVLVCRYLKGTVLEIQHVLPTGLLESQEEAEDRLLKLHRLSQVDFFSRPDEVLEQAYRLQEVSIAYTLPREREPRPR